MRYYTTQRPVSPGSVPGGMTDFQNFPVKTYCEDICREAWGWVEYPSDLTAAQVDQYELVPAGMRIWWSVIKTIQGDKVTAKLGLVTEAIEQPEKRSLIRANKKTFMYLLNSREAAEWLVDDFRT